jgi:hypothetical protein
LISGICLFSSCASEPEPTAQPELTTEKEDLNQAQQVLYSMPYPFELASLLKNSGATFNKELINAPENVSKYTTSKSRALNLGIYGGDLSYASIFGQTQEALKYLQAVKSLTEALGISSAFDNETMNRIDKSMQKKKEQERDDDLQQIVSEAYLTANAFLKDNDRAKIASLILAGGWVEGLYIASSLSKASAKNEELLNMIAEQKFSLENLISLLQSYGDDPQVAEVLKDMNELIAIYNKIDETAEATVSVKTDASKNVTEIGGDSGVSISPEVANEIFAKVSSIRNSYVQ